MPTYEYRCPDGHRFERLAKMSEAAAELPCPECGKLAVRQLSGGAGLVFKGSGFYITDYGKDGKKAATAGASDSAPSTSDSGASKASSASESSSAEKSATSEKREVKPAAETKSSGDSKPATPSKSAAKKSSGKSKNSE